MLCCAAGNHELWWDFAAYKARFGHVMPYSASGSADSMYYSFNLGECFHFVGFNTETAIDTADVSATQLAWLKAVSFVAWCGVVCCGVLCYFI